MSHRIAQRKRESFSSNPVWSPLAPGVGGADNKFLPNYKP